MVDSGTNNSRIKAFFRNQSTAGLWKYMKAAPKTPKEKGAQRVREHGIQHRRYEGSLAIRKVGRNRCLQLAWLSHAFVVYAAIERTSPPKWRGAKDAPKLLPADSHVGMECDILFERWPEADPQIRFQVLPSQTYCRLGHFCEGHETD